jgi:acyl dehydratase
MRTFTGLDELADAAGTDLGTSDWIVVDQARIDAFAEATGDHQWIHTDPARAADGPFGGTIAHGFLTLSLLPAFFAELYRVDGLAMSINYGLNRVRFVSPVRSGSRLRAHSRVVSVDRIDGGAQCVIESTIEIEGAAKPACVAESVVRFVG